MLDIGWSELLVIGVVALIVVGPKDLPRMFNALGRFTGKARSMAREFQRAMDDAAKESGIKDAASDLKAMTGKSALGIDKLEDAARKFEKWDPAKGTRPSAAAAPGSATAKLAEDRAAKAEAVKSAAVASATKAAGIATPQAEAETPDGAPPTAAPESKAGDA